MEAVTIKNKKEINMYISNMKLENFRCFEGITELNFCPGVNYFVGNNNSGKTTIFKAIEFLKSGKTKEGWITKGKENEEVSVEITIKGENLKSLLESEKLKKYQSYLDSNYELKLKRSSQSSTWGNNKEITIKNIALYNPNNNTYENPAGVDNTISALFDAQFVYSDLDNNEFQNLGKSTTIVGKLINTITKDFQNSDEWKNFEKAHADAFGDKGFASNLINLQQRVETLMADQYGETNVEFSFGVPTIENFFKTGQILLEDNGIKTDVSEKGTGMQRALALTLIQVYAQIDTKNEEISKPIFFFIDEPETFLHPIAQNKLIDSLNKLSKQNQVFITTHSPYLLKNFNSNNKLSIFSREQHTLRITEDVNLNMFPYSPTWGEINYKAFNMPSIEFHIDLFGFLHKKAIETKKTYDSRSKTVSSSIISFDQWLYEKNPAFSTDENHCNIYPQTKKQNTPYIDNSMTTYIRNYIDHPNIDIALPDGKYRYAPTLGEITTSIENMLNILDIEF